MWLTMTPHGGVLPGVAMVMRVTFLLLMIASLPCTLGYYVQPEVPTFAESPGSLAVLANNTFTVTCAMLIAGDLPLPQIQWLQDSSPLNETANEDIVFSTMSNSTHLSSRLLVRSASQKHVGRYQCLSKDGNSSSELCSSNDPVPCVEYSTLSGSAWIHVISRNASRLETVEVDLFGSMLLRCGSEFAETLHQSLQISWRRDGHLLGTGDSSELVLLNGDLMMLMDSDVTRRYECFVTIGTDLVHYRSYEVAVPSRESGNLGLSASTTSSVVRSGNGVQLICSITSNNSSSSVSVSWIRQRGNSQEEEAVGGGMALLNGHVLNFEMVSTDAGGTYCCEVVSTRSCVDVAVVNEVASLDPRQVFIDFRRQITHSINISCSHEIRSIHWYRNGLLLENETSHTLAILSDDPFQLYGVYQCSFGQLRGYESPEMHTEARVLPYGVTNPISNFSYHQYLYPDLVVPILLWWSPPLFNGNLSSLSYVVTTGSESSVTSTSSTTRNLQKNANYVVRVVVYDFALGVVSSSTPKIVELTSLCNNYAFYPPSITNLTCSSGSVDVHYSFNETANAEFNFLSFFTQPKNYYFFGGCRDENDDLIYQVLYEKDNASSFSLQGGKSFKAGTWCIIRGANTPTGPSIPSQCVTPRFLQYSAFDDCIVYATVTFEYTSYVAEESTGHVQVCLWSRGYGFNLTLSATSSNTAVVNFEDEVLSIESSGRVCVYVFILDDNILRLNETMVMTLNTSNPYVTMETNSSVITVLDNDKVLLKFSEHSYVVEEQDNLTVCISAHGVWTTNISGTISSQEGADQEETAQVGVDFLPVMETFIFGPSSADSTYCFNIVIKSSNHNARAKTFFLILMSPSPGVELLNATATVTITYSNENKTSPSSSFIILWSMVSVSVAVVAVAVVVMILLCVGSQCFLFSLKQKQRVIEDNFRRRPLVEPFSKCSPDAWPDPILMMTSPPKISVDEDTCSDICSLDYKSNPSAPTAASLSISVSTVSPMTSNSTIGMSVTGSSRRTSSQNCNSSSTLDEYINLFLKPDNEHQRSKPEAGGVQQHCDSSKYLGSNSQMYLVPLREHGSTETAMDSSMLSVDSGIRCTSSRDFQTPKSVEIPSTSVIPAGTDVLDRDLRVEMKYLDQDSGCTMQETSGSSFNRVDKFYCDRSHSNSTTVGLDSGCHVHNTSILEPVLGTAV